MKQRRLNQRGFTILELLIAVTVLSVMLLIASTAVTALTRQFFKGLTKSRTQQVARTISEELISNIQYSTDEPRFLGMSLNGEVQAWCISERAYLFVRGFQLGDDPVQQRPGVAQRWESCTLPGTGVPPDTLTPAPGRVELMGEGMRLADIDICPVTTTDTTNPCYAPDTKVWTVKIRVVYGDNDLVCSPAASDCGLTAVSLNPQAADLSCKFQAGNQFCAAAEYQATAVRRL